MHSTTVALGLGFLGGAWLSLVFTGCGGPQLQQPDAPSAGAPSHPSTSMAERQLDPLLVKASQLQIASQEALAAAKSIGTPDQALTAARQDYAVAEQSLHEGQAAYGAKQYELSWDRLRAADAAFLGQLEHELATEYGRLLTPDADSARRIGSAVHISQGSVNLRDGAGTQFPVIGKAQPSDKLTILAEWGEWYQVRTGTGLVGWVSKMLVTRVRSP